MAPFGVADTYPKMGCLQKIIKTNLQKNINFPFTDLIKDQKKMPSSALKFIESKK